MLSGNHAKSHISSINGDSISEFRQFSFSASILPSERVYYISVDEASGMP